MCFSKISIMIYLILHRQPPYLKIITHKNVVIRIEFQVITREWVLSMKRVLLLRMNKMHFNNHRNQQPIFLENYLVLKGLNQTTTWKLWWICTRKNNILLLINNLYHQSILINLLCLLLLLLQLRLSLQNYPKKPRVYRVIPSD